MCAHVQSDSVEIYSSSSNSSSDEDMGEYDDRDKVSPYEAINKPHAHISFV